MQEKIYNTLHEVYTGVFYPVVYIAKKFNNESEKEDAIKFIAEEINYLYSLNKLWKGFLFKAAIINNNMAITYPLFFGNMNEFEEYKQIKKLTPKEILIKHGHIVKFRDGNYANYFENSLGRFLCIENCICGLNLEDYSDNLIHKNHLVCDIVEIYKVNSTIFFESNFNVFKWNKDFWENKILNYEKGKFPEKTVDLIFKQK